MARPKRYNVDYFPHYISDGKKMFVIESKHGNDGYSCWFKILETLAKSDNHFVNCNDEMNMMYLAAKCRVSIDKLTEIIDDLCKLGEIDEILWNQSKVIWSDKFVESISDAYSKRSNNCITKMELITDFKRLGIPIPLFDDVSDPVNGLKGDVNPQSKVEYSKGKDNKETPTQEEFIDYGLEQAKKHNLNVTKTSLSMKYEAWKLNDWKSGTGVDLSKNWKSSLINTLKYIQEKHSDKEIPNDFSNIEYP